MPSVWKNISDLAGDIGDLAELGMAGGVRGVSMMFAPVTLVRLPYQCMMIRFVGGDIKGEAA